jgi:hypothetical protein
VAEHRRGPGERAGHVADRERRDQRRREALRDVEQRDRKPQPRAVDAPDVGRADAPASEGADVGAPRGAYDPVPEREAPGEIAGDDEGKGLYLGLISYFAAQSLTVAQSRLLKKASM